MDALSLARERFELDAFAKEALGAQIDAVDENGAVCSVTLGPRHRNLVGAVMGGAIFTLADFTFAVASNSDEETTVTQTSQITYLGQPKGTRLVAEARKIKSGRQTCFYLVEVKDELGNDVALVTVTGFKTNG